MSQQEHKPHWILSFCAECGTLLHHVDYLVDGVCQNCGTIVVRNQDRIEGTFTESDAKRLASILQVVLGGD